MKADTTTRVNVITAMRTPTPAMENPLFLMITGKKGVNILVIKPLMTPSRTTPEAKTAWARQRHRIGKGGSTQPSGNEPEKPTPPNAAYR